MSYILDALKKSDQERKRGDVPGLQTVHIPLTAEQKTPWFLYVFIIFLLLTLAFVVGLVVSDRMGNESLVQQQETNVTLPVEVETGLEQDKVPVLPDAMKTNELKTSVVTTSATSIVQQAEQVAPAVVRPQHVETRSVQRQDLGTITELDLSSVPYLHELADYQQQSIPDLKFAGHVYSSTPQSRSVIINGSAMSEGDTILQGLIVEQITVNGVVFRFNNNLFRVDILQDWSFE